MPGRAVLISYAIAGFAALVMVFSLSEMAVVHPAAGSFGVYAETYLNPWAGFVVRYTYWIAQVIAIGGEAVAAGTLYGLLVPGGAGLDLVAGLRRRRCCIVNSRSVKQFRDDRILVRADQGHGHRRFIILGGGGDLRRGPAGGGLPQPVGLPGGFMPHGLQGVWMGVIIGIFSFVGVELIAVTAAETPDPKTAIPAALRSMACRLGLFYLLALTIVVSFIPWTEVGAKVVAESPFVKVFAHTGVAYAAGVMNFVVLTAALSSMNANIYLYSGGCCSRCRAATMRQRCSGG